MDVTCAVPGRSLGAPTNDDESAEVETGDSKEEGTVRIVYSYRLLSLSIVELQTIHRFS